MDTTKLSRRRSPMLAPFALVAPIVVIALCISSPVSAQGQANGPQSPPSAPVTVVNTVANPVPVSGAVTLGNNTATTPVFVQIVKQPVQTPFQQLIRSGSPLTVDSAKQLTIEFVTANCSSDGATTLTSTEVALRTTVGGNFVEHNFSPKFARTFVASAGFFIKNFYISTEMTRIYADPGTTVSIIEVSGFLCDVTVSGYTAIK